ncbi:MAG: hypothetical protein LBV08_07460, partial [Clostridiales bacterium]|nr:hypothetical protein [Clostridiales bacterium]
MKFLKTVLFLAIFMAASTSFFADSVFANGKVPYLELDSGMQMSLGENPGTGNEVVSTNSYINSNATVQKVLSEDNLVRAMATLENGDTVALNIYPQTPVYNFNGRANSVKEGDRVIAAYENSAIISKGEGVPKQIEVAAVFVMGGADTYTARIDKFANSGKVGFFTAKFGDSTTFYDLQGNLISKNGVNNKSLIVIYENIYGVNPSNVTAEKIISLNVLSASSQDLLAKANEYINSLENTAMKDGLKFIRLADFATYY